MARPNPLKVADAHGVALASAGADAWLVTSRAVWHAPVKLEVSDLTEDVLELDLHQTRERGRLRLVLRNDDSRYQQSNEPRALAIGGELLVDPGYITSAGIDVSEGMRLWITLVRRSSGKGASILEIEAVDAWGVLDAWTASKQLVWSADTTSVASVMSQIVAHAGLRLVSSGASAESSTLEPASTVRAGERASIAVHRLVSMVPDILVTRGTELLLHEPLPSDATTYAYGSQHPTTSLRVEEHATDSGRVRVFGNGVFAEAVDATALHIGATTTVIVDANLDAQDRADIRAVTALRRTTLDAIRGELVAPPNVGQEAGDVIEVTSTSLGVTAVRFRVASLRLRYARGGPRPAYEMALALGEV